MRRDRHPSHEQATSGSEKPDWQAGDYAYLGSGSAEWANWPRFVLALRSVGSHEIFELRAGKRGSRLGWRGDDGERIYSKLIAHAKQTALAGALLDATGSWEAPKAGRPPQFSTKDLLALLFAALARAQVRGVAEAWRARIVASAVPRFFTLLSQLSDAGEIREG